MPDAREEVLREFTRQGEVATAHGNCVPADELVFRKVQHIDARAMADEILSLRAARDAAQREREEAERLLAQSVANTDNAMESARLAIAQRDAAQAANERLIAAAKDLLRMGRHDGPCEFEEDGGACTLHLEAVKARTLNMQAALDAALPAAEGEG